MSFIRNWRISSFQNLIFLRQQNENTALWSHESDILRWIHSNESNEMDLYQVPLKKKVPFAVREELNIATPGELVKIHLIAGGRTCFGDIWIFAKFLIGLHGVLQIPLFKIWTDYVLKYGNFKSVGVDIWTPLKILIFLHSSYTFPRVFPHEEIHISACISACGNTHKIV